MKIYLDTSVISALFDDNNLERKLLTEEFLEKITGVEIFISDLTMAEINRAPDIQLRRSMNSVVADFKVLPIPDEVEELAEKYVNIGCIPTKYKEDAYHIAIAVINEIDFLLSWNFRHIVRRKTKDAVNLMNTLEGFKHIEIITPAELL